MQYQIISSGSKGNCVIINDVMVDCGLSFKAIKQYLYDIKILLITHAHSDHVNRKTIAAIKKQFPKIKIVGNYEVHQKHGTGVICNAGYETVIKPYRFYPFIAPHDVLCYGYAWTFEDQNIIYCTDTYSMENAPSDRKYDYIFLESNYDEAKMKTIDGNSNKYGYNVVRSAMRHLSTKKCKEFYYMNRRNKDSKLIELHKSERFY